MPRLTTLTVALALASLTAAAACKKAAPPPPPAPTVAPPPAAPPAPDNSACVLVPQDTVSRALGHPVNAGTIGTAPGAPALCHYVSDPPPGVDISLWADGDDGLRATLKAQTMGAEPVQMQGLGTRAYRNADGTTVGVLAHGKFVVITAPAHVAEALAQTVTPHL